METGGSEMEDHRDAKGKGSTLDLLLGGKDKLTILSASLNLGVTLYLAEMNGGVSPDASKKMRHLSWAKIIA
ncbi:hypothetical protein RRG08_057112 [Elysia crispata]|uniref:Uncharacterized protein n=1 Tax=Elysia crispata TaxID=231223 RepID=A0AAE1B9D6_9GAST|nr:hypothetical protein RRG08_057112 [Elysia crispata]